MEHKLNRNDRFYGTNFFQVDEDYEEAHGQRNRSQHERVGPGNDIAARIQAQ